MVCLTSQTVKFEILKKQRDEGHPQTRALLMHREEVRVTQMTGAVPGDLKQLHSGSWLTPGVDCRVLMFPVP